MQNTKFFSREVINVAVISSLSSGFLDALLEKPSEFCSVSFLLLPPVTAAIVFFSGFILLWLPTRLVFKKIPRLNEIPVSITMALFLEMLTLKYSQTPNFLYYILGPGFVTWISVFVVIPLLITATAYFVCSAIVKKEYLSRYFSIFCFFLPLILAETTICIWILRYAIKSFVSANSFLIYILYSLITAIILWRFLKVKNRDNLKKIIYIFCGIFILSPLISFASERIYESITLRSSKNHNIKHVILIIDDTLRADALSCYNSDAKPTPNIDNFSKEGIVFEDAISAAPWTLPAIASIMTGLSPSVHVVTTTSRNLSDNFETLAEKMRSAGYSTCAIGYNAVLHHSYNMSQGFNEYAFFPKWYGFSFGKTVLMNLFPENFLSKPGTGELTNIISQWLEKNRSNDFFLWIHYFDPHLPYSPPRKYLDGKKAPNSMKASLINREPIRKGKFVPTSEEKKWIKTLYDAEVSYVDENIGKLFNTLRELKLYDNSMIIFTSDHGEEFWEHGGFEHGHTVYNELLKVPLIIKLPFSSSGKTIENPVTTQNLMPTILKTCGIPDETDFTPSDTLTSLFTQSSGYFVEKPIISVNVFSSVKLQCSVIFNGMKYITVKVEGNQPVEELYDLIVDPGEKNSVADLHKDKLDKAKSILKDFDKISTRLRKKYDILQKEEIDINKNVAHELRTLGYIQ